MNANMRKLTQADKHFPAIDASLRLHPASVMSKACARIQCGSSGWPLVGPFLQHSCLLKPRPPNMPLLCPFAFLMLLVAVFECGKTQIMISRSSSLASR